MKLKYIMTTLLIIIVYTISISVICFAAHIIENNLQPDSYKMVATAYCIEGTTATGTQTRPGVAAGKREWFGKTVTIYEQDENGNVGELIGKYTIEDIGGKPIRQARL